MLPLTMLVNMKIQKIKRSYKCKMFTLSINKPTINKLQHFQTVDQTEVDAINEYFVNVEQNDFKTGQSLYFIMQSSTISTNKKCLVVQDFQLFTSPATTSSVKRQYNHLSEIPFDRPQHQNIEILIGADYANFHYTQKQNQETTANQYFYIQHYAGFCLEVTKVSRLSR